ncbi:MAG: TonB-dependent receptor [Kordiimonadaceae bacterium]|nr:TonB-dependent receptor [Kordiimonadaceae bacterium]
MKICTTHTANLKTVTSILALSLSATAMTHTVSAAGQDDEFAFEEIIVTGEKRAKSLQDTQVSVAVLTGETLNRQVVIDIEEALLRIGNADIATTGDLSIRGISKQGPTGGVPTNRMVLGYYVDGIALSGQAQRFALSNWDIGQIEVLRGPVTTVQGRNALAGGLIITTGTPENEWGGKARISYGEHNTYQLAAALTGPLVEDILAFRVSVDHNKSDGYVTNTTRNEDDYGQSDSTTIRGKLRFEPASLPDFTATAAFTHITMDRTAGMVEILGPDFEARTSISGAPTVSKTDGISLYSLTMDYDFSDHFSVRSVTAYQESDVINEGPFQETDPNNPQRTTFGLFEDSLFSQELLFTYTSDRFTALTGFYYADIENRQERGGTFEAGLFNPQLFGLDAVNVSPLTEEISNYAGFLDLSFQLNEWLELTGGIRIDKENNSFTRSSSGLSIPALSLDLFPALPATTTENSGGTEVLPKIGVVASLNDDVSLGFTYSRGYRPGGSGVNLIELLRTGQPDFFEYDAEQTDNYEVSFRSQWFERALTINANAYMIDWSNQQVNIFGSFGAGFDDTIITNAGASTVKGLEVEITGHIGRLDLFTSFAFSDTEFDEFIANGQDFQGLEFSRSPNFSGSAGFSYDFENGFFLSGNVNHMGSSYQNNENSISLDSYTIVNVTAAYEGENYRVFAFAKNLFDETATTQISFEGPAELRRLRPPRYIGAGVEFSF